MQERLVARRILHIMSDELSFECMTSRLCECGVVIDQYSDAGSRAFQRLLGATIDPVDPDFAPDWVRIVMEYSTLEFTYAADVLPALSGIVRSLEHLSPGKYIAGLWERDIAYQLTWSLSYQNER
jgi:hypothetical protein